ncbi:MAG: Hsp20 family protein, partial [Gammaproteobacteria bacterium]|nr:Hsp20 family protein [Gammaproteobacteria bacterium]
DTQIIEFALAGFSADDVDINVENNIVTITGAKEDDERDYIWNGISARKFAKKFTLTDYWEVIGAEFKDGILVISLKQEIPDAQKPKQIEIK